MVVSGDNMELILQMTPLFQNPDIYIYKLSNMVLLMSIFHTPFCFISLHMFCFVLFSNMGCFDSFGSTDYILGLFQSPMMKVAGTTT